VRPRGSATLAERTTSIRAQRLDAAAQVLSRSVWLCLVKGAKGTSRRDLGFIGNVHRVLVNALPTHSTL
jgi:hypothetical protein